MNYWFMPCNTKKFDICEHFKQSAVFYWRPRRPYSEGDNVYLYLTAPDSQIKYRCVVLDAHVGRTEVEECGAYALKLEAFRYIKLELAEEYPDSLFPLKELTSNGLGTTQSQCSMPRKTLSYMQRKIAQMNANE